MTEVSFFAPVRDYIPRVEARMRSQSNGHHPELQAALKQLITSGGKRVRPTVTLLVGQMYGVDLEQCITLAAAVELLHTATLVHDDLIDGALLRRGMPTLNAQWSPAATILTGDFIFAQAARLAAETNSIEVMKLFSKTLSVIVNGEITQIFKSRGLASREDYFARIYAKTASMFELASVAPGYLGATSDEQLEALRSFGYEVGMAFQIVDDILDFTSQQEDIGKPVASDLRQGLITLPALYYLENELSDPDVQNSLRGDISDDETILRLTSLIRESGAVESALREAAKYAQRGISALSGMPEGPERQALEELANYVVERHI